MRHFADRGSGGHWGVSTMDGSAAPDSIENRVQVATFLLQMGGGLAFAGLIAFGAAAAAGMLKDVPHVDWIFAVMVFSTAVFMPVVWLGVRHLPLAFVPLVIVISTGLMTVTAFALGDRLSPYITIGYVALGACSFVILQRRAAIAQVLLIALAYAVVLAVQPGNGAPVFRWTISMAGIVFVGATISGLVERVRRLVEAEHAARALAEVAQATTAELNRTLERRVAEQVQELSRLGRLRRFLSKTVADAVLSSGSEDLLQPHRQEIAVFFCDLRDFTAFAASARPEEVDRVLSDYFDLLGDSVGRYQATVGAFTGDGLMAFFNDPLPCSDPALRAVAMALELQVAMRTLLRCWEQQGYRLGFGVGIALGNANIGMIGFESRRDYTALGPVVNLASRLCTEAQSGETLIDQRARDAGDGVLDVDERRWLKLKGYEDRVAAFSVRGVASDRPADSHI
jgi:class 3 adenylate cyclase